jgi:ParB family chromosome partitioning protein
MTTTRLSELPIEELQRGKFQPRQHFDQNALAELAASITTQGLIEPIIVRPIGPHQYEIIAGERRWRAAQIAKLSMVPCLIKDYSDEQAAAVSLVENIQRENLNPIEEAKGYLRLNEEFAFAHDEIAILVGKSRATVSNSLRLLKLDNRVQQLIIDNAISVGHAKVLATLPEPQQYTLALDVISHQWSVRHTEKAIQPSSTPMNPKKDRNIARLEQMISEQCSTQSVIETDSNGAGWLKLKFFDNDTLAGILDKLGVDYTG